MIERAYCGEPEFWGQVEACARRVAEEVMRSALTEKEEHVRRVVREEVQKTRVPWDVLRKEMLKHVPSASFCEGPNVGSSEVRLDKEPPFPFKTSACESSATLFGGIPIVPDPSMPPGTMKAVSYPGPSLREFIEAADTLKERLLIVAPGSFTERYDTARSRIDVEEMEKLEEHRDWWKAFNDAACEHLRKERDTLRTELAEANRALDWIADAFKPPELGSRQLWQRVHDTLKSSGRLKETKP